LDDWSQGGCSAYVLPVGDDEDGWTWQEGGRARWQERGNRQRNYYSTTEETSKEALEERWINPEEDDDIAAPKFLCGGGQLDKGGVGMGIGWELARNVAGTRYGVLGYICAYLKPTQVGSHDRYMAGAGGQLSLLSFSSVWHVCIVLYCPNIYSD